MYFYFDVKMQYSTSEFLYPPLATALFQAIKKKNDLWTFRTVFLFKKVFYKFELKSLPGQGPDLSCTRA